MLVSSGLIYLSICVSYRRSCISIPASCQVTDFTQWMLILLSQHNWWRSPAGFTAHPNPAFSQWQLRSQATMNTHPVFMWAISPDCPLPSLSLYSTWTMTVGGNTQTHRFRHAHLPACSVTLTWVGFTAVQAVSSINMCLLAGGPLCLHSREAINRKASPRVCKLLFRGGTLMRRWTLITVLFSV